MDPRIGHARRIAECFATDPRARAVILGGSVARGEARDDSDIDVGVFWSELPSDDELTALRALAGLTVHRAVPNAVRFDHAIPRQFGDINICSVALGGSDTLVVDIEHQSASGTELLISQVMDDLVTSLDHQELFSVIQGGIALHGAPLIEAWRDALTPYPEALRRKAVEEQMLGTRGVAARMRRQTEHLRREDWLWLIDERMRIVERLVITLMALNRVWAPSRNERFKHLTRIVSMCQEAPADCASRIGKTLQSEPQDALRHLRRLVSDVLDLAGQAFPDIDMSDELDALHG